MLEQLHAFLLQGGPVMIPLFAVAALAFGMLFERWHFFRAAGPTDPERWIERLRGESTGRANGTRPSPGATGATGATGPTGAAGAADGGLLYDFVATTVQTVDWRASDRPALLRRRELEFRRRLDAGLLVLGMLAALAPLLGLLGTVTGMIRTFQLMASVGVTDSRGLSLGIAEALITTQVGLSIALPTLVGRRWIAARAERFQQSLHQLAAAALAAPAVPATVEVAAAGNGGPHGTAGAHDSDGHRAEGAHDA